MLPDNGSIEFCKKRPSMVLQFGDRLSAVAGSPLGLISLKNQGTVDIAHQEVFMEEC